MDSPFDEDAHRVWCAEENFGVSHTGAFPKDYDISKICFDVFRSAVVKVFLKYLCTLLEGMPRNLNLMKSFLSKLPGWDGYVLDPWVANESQQRLRGRHTKSFTNAIPQCTSLLTRIILEGYMSDICVCLMSFLKLSKVLSLVFIDFTKQ